MLKLVVIDWVLYMQILTKATEFQNAMHELEMFTWDLVKMKMTLAHIKPMD